MIGLVKTAVVLAAGTLLLGCDRSGYETAPVVLKHGAGKITCQLYTVDRVMWDHAIDFPDAISKADADAVCFAEGERRLAEYKAAKKAAKG